MKSKSTISSYFTPLHKKTTKQNNMCIYSHQGHSSLSKITISKYSTPHQSTTPNSIESTSISETPPSPSSFIPEQNTETPPSPPSTSCLKNVMRTPPTENNSTFTTSKKRSFPHYDNNEYRIDTDSTIKSPIIKQIQQNQPRKKQQVYLDFGQASFGQRTICKTCNMLYVHGIEEDESNHRKICQDYIFGVAFTLSKNLRIISTHEVPSSSIFSPVKSGFFDTSNHKGRFEKKNQAFIIEVRPTDPIVHRRKVLQVKSIVDKEMGFVSQSSSQLTSSLSHLHDASTSGNDDMSHFDNITAYLYIHNKRVIGFCTAKIIKEAYKLVSNDENNKNDTKTNTTSSTMNQKDDFHNHSDESQLYDKSQTFPAMIGIHQIWSHRNHRKRGIAKMLVDACRSKMVYGMVVPIHMVAFSSPTEDGAIFAKRYTQSNTPLVYVCK